VDLTALPSSRLRRRFDYRKGRKVGGNNAVGYPWAKGGEDDEAEERQFENWQPAAEVLYLTEK